MNLDEITRQDWLDFVRSLPAASVDLIATDPAYPSLMKWQGIGTTARMGMGRKGTTAADLENKFFPVMDALDLPDMMQEFYRVLKPGGHAYVMCNEETERDLYNYSVVEGVWDSYKVGGVVLPAYRKLVWVKRNAGMGYPFLHRYECVAFLFKGTMFNREGQAVKRRRLNVDGVPDVLTYSELRGDKAQFPTQKPDEMFEDFIAWSTQPGDIVLDPFCGSGTTARAAKRLGRHFLTCDIWDRAIEVATRRVGEVEFGEVVAMQQRRMAFV